MCPTAQVNVEEDLWEMENTRRALPTKFIPLGTIVTVFGTGSEMNSGAVITHEQKKIKGALWGAQADFAFLAPAHSLSVPMKQVISGAFDTLSHAMETYFGKPDENNLSDDLGEAVMRATIRNIRVLLTDPQNYDARSELAWASAMAENGVLKIGKSTAQIILRWYMQDSNIVIPGSKNPDHIRVNFDLFDFELTEEEMEQIAALNKNVRYYTSTPELLKKYAEMVPPVDRQK